MADYWKSQPKKFCDYCKCWIADNKPSIDFHERGKNHKENVAKKISEIKKKSLEKAKEEEKMSKEFAAMEEAAMKAYQEDLKRIGATTESQWEKPEEFQDNLQELQKTAQWMEGTSEDGRTYYYNTETGVSAWEKPDNFVSPSKESQKENHPEDSQEMESKKAESDARKAGSKSELQKPKRNLRRKTESDDDVEEKPHRRKKISPYGEWQKVKQESSDIEDVPAVRQETSQAASRRVKPYGEWEEITEDKDPYEKIDLELPNVESDSLPAPVLEAPEDAKVIFKERTVTSLGDTTDGIPVFKKRKFENGKSRNIRQRLNDH
ncbi:WW domain-binding protein 4 isoform X3 [Podarcis raffonei]|uniref:WW domain-binding protein 4 isoform X3 n=1 Tax=Podarcis raffonei TaxID=65483 RepID=UPI0023292B56|nr:WW domain-binding protein 4 isoform X3 [Podarcis raffonei]